MRGLLFILQSSQWFSPETEENSISALHERYRFLHPVPQECPVFLNRPAGTGYVLCRDAPFWSSGDRLFGWRHRDLSVKESRGQPKSGALK